MAPSEMVCSKSALFRFTDMVFIALVFLFQNVILNYIIILHHSSSIFSFLWFLGDFFCLILFSFTIFLAHTYHRKIKLRERRSASRASYTSVGLNRSATPQGSETSDESFVMMNRIFGNSQLPLTYVSWLFYACLLTMKITVLFKTDVAQNLKKDDFLGPQMLKFCVGLSTVVFSLLVESHHNAVNDSLRNSYLNALSFQVALEILDSVSFLSLLLPAESRLIYPFGMENYIIALSAVNIMLPAVTIFKLSASNFGRAYNVPLEVVYKSLHLVLVNGPFLLLRLYLWQMFSTDSAIFMIKNIYAIINFVRGIYPDIKLLRQVVIQRMQLQSLSPSGKQPQPNGNHPPISESNGNAFPQDVEGVYCDEQPSPTSSTSVSGISVPRSMKRYKTSSIEGAAAPVIL